MRQDSLNGLRWAIAFASMAGVYTAIESQQSEEGDRHGVPASW
jgi:hypothetical protein